MALCRATGCSVPPLGVRRRLYLRKDTRNTSKNSCTTMLASCTAGGISPV